MKAKVLERGKALIDAGYRNVSWRRKKGLIVLENPKGKQKSISVRSLSEKEVEMVLKALRSYRDQEKEPVAVELAKEDEKAYEIVEQIWNDPEYLAEFLDYGPDHVLELHFSDVDFDRDAAKLELRLRLQELGKEIVRRGRESRNPLYLLLGNFLKDIASEFNGFRKLSGREVEKYGEIIREKYHKAWVKVSTEIVAVLEGMLFVYLKIPRELWRDGVAKNYESFMQAFEQFYKRKEAEKISEPITEELQNRREEFEALNSTLESHGLTFEEAIGLLKEIKDLRSEKESLENEVAKLRRELWEVKKELEDKKAEISRAVEDLTWLQFTAPQLRIQRIALERDVQSLESQKKRLEKEVTSLEKRIKEMEEMEMTFLVRAVAFLLKTAEAVVKVEKFLEETKKIVELRDKALAELEKGTKAGRLLLGLLKELVREIEEKKRIKSELEKEIEELKKLEARARPIPLHAALVLGAQSEKMS